MSLITAAKTALGIGAAPASREPSPVNPPLESVTVPNWDAKKAAHLMQVYGAQGFKISPDGCLLADCGHFTVEIVGAVIACEFPDIQFNPGDTNAPAAF